jgi:hypothetical protein
MDEAFRQAAGFYANGLDMFFRGIIASLFSLWTIWVVFNQFQLVITEQLSVIQWVFNTITVVIVYTMVLVLVAL